jgi:hypothetical protein
MTFLSSLRLHLARVLVRHGYHWVPTDQATAIPDKWVRPTRGPADLSCGPIRPSWWPTRPLEDLPEDSADDLNQNDLKTWCIR